MSRLAHFLHAENRPLRRFLMVKFTVTAGVLAHLYLPGEIALGVGVGANLVWLWFDN